MNSDIPDEVDLEEQADAVADFVEELLGQMDIDAIAEPAQQGDRFYVDILEGPPEDLALLIGKHGQTIDALQYVANAASFRSGAGKPVTIDAAGYRERRRTTLEGIALRAAEQAVTGERVLLEPMTAVERKVVHERLKDVAGVATSSEGTEPNRYVVVSPA